MSRVSSIEELQTAVTAAERKLGDEIHKIFHSDRVIWYQVGFSEHPGSWEQRRVIGPHDKFNIIIGLMQGMGHLVVDGRSERLALEEPKSEESLTFTRF